MTLHHDRRLLRDRRRDRNTAERIDLAVLTAKAFDERAASSYLTLSGVAPSVVRGFMQRYPGRLRMPELDVPDRRRQP